jgi:glutamine synthetase
LICFLKWDLNHIEVEARYEIELEEYTKIQIEGRVLGDISKSRNPTAIRYQNTLIENVKV